MLTSLALIFLVGMTLGWVFSRLRLPSLLGMLLTGILLGPYVLNLLDGSILGISADLRQAGPHHHPHPGRPLPPGGRPQKGGASRRPHVFPTRLL